MTEHAHHNIASAASPDDAAREAAPSDELSSSSAGQPSAPEARAKTSRAQRFADRIAPDDQILVLPLLIFVVHVSSAFCFGYIWWSKAILLPILHLL